MNFIISLIAMYVYFSVALCDSLKKVSCAEPAIEDILLIEITEPEEITGDKVAMAKTASFVEKSGYPL